MLRLCYVPTELPQRFAKTPKECDQSQKVWTRSVAGRRMLAWPVLLSPSGDPRGPLLPVATSTVLIWFLVPNRPFQSRLIIKLPAGRAKEWGTVLWDADSPVCNFRAELIGTFDHSLWSFGAWERGSSRDLSDASGDEFSTWLRH